MKYRIIYDGDSTFEAWVLQKKYRFWPFWITMRRMYTTFYTKEDAIRELKRSVSENYNITEYTKEELISETEGTP